MVQLALVIVVIKLKNSVSKRQKYVRKHRRIFVHSAAFWHRFLKIYFHWMICKSWWRHQMETLSTLLAICAGNSPVTGELPSKRPVTRSFDVFFDLRIELTIE